MDARTMICYNLAVTMQSAAMKFSLEIIGEEMGSQCKLRLREIR